MVRNLKKMKKLLSCFLFLCFYSCVDTKSEEITNMKLKISETNHKLVLMQQTLDSLYKVCCIKNAPTKVAQSKKATKAPLKSYYDTKEYKSKSNKNPSSVCGARTAKGGYCKRKVSGGGRCYQH